jgi:hypothetical protein
MMPRQSVENATHVDLMRLLSYDTKVTKWYKLLHNSGTGTGTGAQQTIKHSLGSIPKIVTFSPIAASTAHIMAWESAPADAVNLYVATINTKQFTWYAEA